MTIEIVKAEISNAPALVELMNALGYSHTCASIAMNLQAVEERAGRVFLAVVEGAVVGCICAIIDVRLASGKYGEIVSLVVSAEYRGRGIARSLLKHAETWLAERTSRVRIRANTVRDGAHVFYKSLGYEEQKTQKIFTKLL